MLSDREKLGLLFTYVERRVERDKYEDIDLLLRSLDIEKDAIIVLTGVIRITARYREVLPSWRDTFLLIAAEVKKRKGGLEADRILTGLVL